MTDQQQRIPFLDRIKGVLLREHERQQTPPPPRFRRTYVVAPRHDIARDIIREMVEEERPADGPRHYVPVTDDMRLRGIFGHQYRIVVAQTRVAAPPRAFYDLRHILDMAQHSGVVVEYRRY